MNFRTLSSMSTIALGFLTGIIFFGFILFISPWTSQKKHTNNTPTTQTHPSSFQNITPDAVTHHTLSLHGKTYAYTARAGTITLHNEKNNPTARLFYTAYTLDNASPEKRPLTFFYNGGPGSSSMLLRMASFGPKRVILNGHKPPLPAPYHLEDNEYSLLDKTDLVFIDAPGTGFGRLAENSKSEDFFGVDKDVEAFTAFIQQYISTNHRWNSPKYLFGESYGTTRTGILVNALQENGTQINGVILQSSILDYGLMGDRIGGGDWQYVLYLPSLAATAWYFHTSDYHPDSQEALLKEVEQFATTDYLEALAQGSQLPESQFNAIAQKLHQYLGLSLSYIKHKNLRIPSGQFASILLNKKNEHMGRFDARFTLYGLDKGKSLFKSSSKTTPDPTMVSVKDAVLAMSNQYLITDLHYASPLPYLANIPIYRKWNFKHDDQWVVNASYDLANAMVENPHLRVFSANGYYDFATPFFATVYTLQHLSLPPNLENHITLKFYPAGHMIYFDPESLKQYRQDLDMWYNDAS